VPLVTWLWVSILGEESDVVWRIVLGLGCVPGVILLIIALYWRRKNRLVAASENIDSQPLSPPEMAFTLADQGLEASLIKNEIPPPSTGQDNHDNDENANESSQKRSLLHALTHESNLCQKLLGTAGTWFLFDIIFYGNTLFQPIVLSKAFGASESIDRTCRDAAILSTLALPGYFVSYIMIGTYQSPKEVQMQGFAIMAVLYIIIGSFWAPLTNLKWLLLLLYGMTFFFANYGPNATTFLLPSTTFSVNCRSTLNGVSAASGKIGALLGAMMFEPLAERFGDDTIMFICAGGAIVSFAMTKCFVR